MHSAYNFILPQELHAKEPPEARGVGRDGVRLLVLNRIDGLTKHDVFRNLTSHLRRGDLLVFNASRTLPAVLQAKVRVNQSRERSQNKERSLRPKSSAAESKARSKQSNVEIRLAERLADGSWLALLLCQGLPKFDGSGLTFDQNEISDVERFACGLNKGMILDFSNELSAKVLERDKTIPRLWKLEFSLTGQQFFEQIYALGKPIRYEYVPEDWALDNYQTIYATEPGSAEMPSAGRAFSWDVMFRLKKAGVNTTNIVLHTGLSSYMDDELDAQHPASEEEYFISECAAEAIKKTRLAGGRVIAVGTTVVRTLESEFAKNGYLAAAHGRTRLHLDREFQPKIVDGLITGLHEPQASHLDLLSAFVEPQTLFAAYQEALDKQYLWHEFGDVNLII